MGTITSCQIERECPIPIIRPCTRLRRDQAIHYLSTLVQFGSMLLERKGYESHKRPARIMPKQCQKDEKALSILLQKEGIRQVRKKFRQERHVQTPNHLPFGGKPVSFTYKFDMTTTSVQRIGKITKVRTWKQTKFWYKRHLKIYVLAAKKHFNKYSWKQVKCTEKHSLLLQKITYVYRRPDQTWQ